VCNEVWVGIALAADDIVAVGSVVGVTDAQATSRPDSKNNTIVLFFIFLTLQKLIPRPDEGGNRQGDQVYSSKQLTEKQANSQK